MSAPVAETLQVKVKRKYLEAKDICVLEMVSLTGLPLPRFSAGSHVDIYLPNGLIRQYSLCNAPHETHRYVIAVKKDPASRGGSNAIHEELSEGQSVRIGLPRNSFSLAEDNTRKILIGGGIGITPLLSMAEKLKRENKDFVLHYSARSLKQMAFLEKMSDFSLTTRVKLYCNDQEVYRAFDADEALRSETNGAQLYVCGPHAFIENVLGTARLRGWDESNLYFEHFKVESFDSVDSAFEVEIVSTGQIVFVNSTETIVQALRNNKILIPVSCEQGVCGTCLTGVLEGVCDHRDFLLSDEERGSNKKIIPCCSRSKSPKLILEL